HETRNQVLHKLNSMYTWLVELGSGLTGVLSTVTMGATLSTDNCGAVNSGVQKRPQIAVLAQSKFRFNGLVTIGAWFRAGIYGVWSASAPWVHASLIGRE